METRTSFTQTHLENKLMLNELDFFREELGILERHLETLHTRNTSLQESEGADSFRNQFARNRDLINGLERELVEAEKKMAMFAKANDKTDLDAVNVADHAAFREQYNSFREAYQSMKQQFKDFESNWS